MGWSDLCYNHSQSVVGTPERTTGGQASHLSMASGMQTRVSRLRIQTLLASDLMPGMSSSLPEPQFLPSVK